jgi:hypothetical protein
MQRNEARSNDRWRVVEEKFRLKRPHRFNVIYVSKDKEIDHLVGDAVVRLQEPSFSTGDDLMFGL